MNGLALMAGVVVLTGGGGWLLALYSLTGRTLRFGRLMPFGLPMSAAVNVLVKAPFIAAIGAFTAVPTALASRPPLAMILFLWVLPPLTEEAAKLLPLLVPAIRRMIADRYGAVWAGMAIGVGYGLGEAIYLAVSLGDLPEYVNLPWFAFTGFFFERQLTFFVHGVLAAVSYAGIQRGGRWIVFGYLGAAALHALTNLGALFSRIGLIPAAAGSLWLLVIVVGLSLVFDRLRRRAAPAHRVEMLLERPR